MVGKLRGIRILYFVIFNLFIAIFVWSGIVEATGGAFPYSKHGAKIPGDNDAQFGGVRRKKAAGESGNGIGDDSTLYVYPIGVYGRGECTQCHEPHASYGGTEPYPNFSDNPSFMSPTEAQGPDLYLLFADNNSNLCWTCHETFQLTQKPDGFSLPTGYCSYGFFQGKTVYEQSTHGDSTKNRNMVWPGITTGDQIHPRKRRTVGEGICLNCHTPHGIISKVGTFFDTVSPDGTGGVPADKQTVGNNKSVTTDYLIPRQKIAWEEMLCENCHDATGPALTDIQSEINKRHFGGSGHPVDDINLAGRHVVTENIPVGTASDGDAPDTLLKHVECYDCHNPHADKSSNRLEGMKYIDVDQTEYDPAQNPANQPFVYQLCFKCHGDSFAAFIPEREFPADGGIQANQLIRTTYKYTSGAGFGSKGSPASENTTGSNKRLEFNPDSISGGTISNTAYQSSKIPADQNMQPSLSRNTAYHPVAAPGRNTTPALRRQLIGGLTPEKTIQCTDCHNNNALENVEGTVTESKTTRATDVPSNYAGASPVGPHGSTNPRILRANYNTTLGRWRACRRGGPGNTPSGSNCWDDPFDSYNRDNFALCFLCHDEEAFTQETFDEGAWKTNFYSIGNDNNLHAAHLAGKNVVGNTKVYSTCANCHYNVHSNLEATNTTYDSVDTDFRRGSSTAGTNGSTRLINFSPIVGGGISSAAFGIDSNTPAWGNILFAGSWRMGCFFNCHGFKQVMPYTPPYFVE